MFSFFCFLSATHWAVGREVESGEKHSQADKKRIMCFKLQMQKNKVIFDREKNHIFFQHMEMTHEDSIQANKLANKNQLENQVYFRSSSSSSPVMFFSCSVVHSFTNAYVSLSLSKLICS